MSDRTTREICSAVQAKTALYYGVSVVDILSYRNSGNALVARRCAMFVAHLVFHLPYYQVAKGFQRDHTTVMNACKFVREHPAMMQAAYAIGLSMLGENEGFLPPGEFDEFPPVQEDVA